jgi:hypothetical protein
MSPSPSEVENKNGKHNLSMSLLTWTSLLQYIPARPLYRQTISCCLRLTLVENCPLFPQTMMTKMMTRMTNLRLFPMKTKLKLMHMTRMRRTIMSIKDALA